VRACLGSGGCVECAWSARGVGPILYCYSTDLLQLKWHGILYVPHGCYQYTFDLKSSGHGVAWQRYAAAEGVPVGTVTTTVCKEFPILGGKVPRDHEIYSCRTVVLVVVSLTTLQCAGTTGPPSDEHNNQQLRRPKTISLTRG
jgi:hypothetical protein